MNEAEAMNILKNVGFIVSTKENDKKHDGRKRCDKSLDSSLDDVFHKERMVENPNDKRFVWCMTPLIYFCTVGNLSMCQWLVLRHNADLLQSSSEGYHSPMLSASQNGHLHICQWLFKFHQQITTRKISVMSSPREKYVKDKSVCLDIVRKRNSCNFSSLSAAVGPSAGNYCCDAQERRKNVLKIAQFLILNGALSSSTCQIDDGMLRMDLKPIRVYGKMYDERSRLLAWSQNTITEHEHFKSFIQGTKVVSTPIQLFNGNSDILGLIQTYVVGHVSENDVGTLKSLAMNLEAYIRDTPVDETVPCYW